MAQKAANEPNNQANGNLLHLGLITANVERVDGEGGRGKKQPKDATAAQKGAQVKAN